MIFPWFCIKCQLYIPQNCNNCSFPYADAQKTDTSGNIKLRYLLHISPAPPSFKGFVCTCLSEKRANRKGRFPRKRVFSATECHQIPCCFCQHYEEQCLHPYLPYLLYRVCHIQAFLSHRVAQEIWGSLFAELMRVKIPISFQYLYQMLARADTKALNCPHLCSVFLYFHPTETNTQHSRKKKKKKTHMGKLLLRPS